MTDRLLDGRAFQALTVVDNFSRLSPIIEVAQPMTSGQVIEALERVRNQVGLPLTITCDNGSQFTSRRMDAWAYDNDVRLDFIRPGKPVENAYIESFNGRFRDECLNSHEFESLEALKTVTSSSSALELLYGRAQWNECSPIEPFLNYSYNQCEADLYTHQSLYH